MIDIRDEHMKALAAVPVVARTLLTTNTGAGGADWIRDQPAAGEWAAIEVAAHMADADQRADYLTHVTAEDVDHRPRSLAWSRRPDAARRQRDAFSVRWATSAVVAVILRRC